VGSQVSGCANKHVHDCLGWFLRGRERVEIRQVGYIQNLEGGALVCRDSVGEGTALRWGEWGVCGVLDDGAELGEGGLGEELDGDAN
jgi:hypothetical protein